MRSSDRTRCYKRWRRTAWLLPSDTVSRTSVEPNRRRSVVSYLGAGFCGPTSKCHALLEIVLHRGRGADLADSLGPR